MSDIRRGVVTQMGMDPVEAFHHAGDIGLDFVEIMMDGDGHRDALADRADTLTAAADEHGLDRVVHLPFTVDIGTPHGHVRRGSIAEIEACIETAAALGVEKAVLHASSEAWDAAWDGDRIRELILDGVRTLDEAGRDRGIEICVENIPGGFFTVHDFDRLFDETDAAMTLDTGHARIDGMESLEIAEFVAEHRDRISHVHLNDTRVAEDGHVPFGSGTLDFDAILDPLRSGWQGTLSLEVFTFDWEYIEMSAERLDRLL